MGKKRNTARFYPLNILEKGRYKYFGEYVEGCIFTYKTRKRKVITLTVEHNKLRTQTYARYVMEQTLGRKLSCIKQVHHKDGNPENDNYENLVVIYKGAHRKFHKLGEENKFFIKHREVPGQEVGELGLDKGSTEGVSRK